MFVVFVIVKELFLSETRLWRCLHGRCRNINREGKRLRKKIRPLYKMKGLFLENCDWRWDMVLSLGPAYQNPSSRFIRAPTARKTKTQPMMATIFWELLLKEKRPISYKQKKLILHHCRVHKAHKLKDIIRDCSFIELYHPPYSPD